MLSNRTSLALLLIVLVALGVRLFFLMDPRFAIDSDEAIVGLMAKHITEGREIPIFYYGQHYMGALEAYLASISFKLFGISPFTLQLVPLCFSLLLILLLFFIGNAVASTRAGLLAALLAAIPPPAFLIWGLKARGGFIELLFIGALAFLIAIRWFAPRASSVRYPASIGFVCGIGWWVNNQILYFMVAIATCWVVVAVWELRCRNGRGESDLSYWLLGCVRDVVSGTASFFVGGGLFWYYNVKNGFPSLSMFQSVDFGTFTGQLYGVLTEALPALLGARRFWHNSELFPGAGFVSMCCLLLVVLLSLKACRRPKELHGAGRGVWLLVIFIPICCAVFASSSYGWLVSAPRYLLPIYVAVFVLSGVAIDFLSRNAPVLGVLSVVCFLGWNLFALVGTGKAIGGQPLVFGADRVPLDNEKVIAMLNARGITHVHCSYWVGYRLAFESQEAITFSMIGTPYQIRIPEYELTEGASPSPYLLVKREAEIIAPALARLGYAFEQEVAGDYILLWQLRDLYPATEAKNPSLARVKSNIDSPLDPSLAIDGDVLTRWGTGTRQQPGQSLDVLFEKPSRIAGIRVLHGEWRQDYPRRLKVELLGVNDSVLEVLSGVESVGIHYVKQRSDFTLRFPEQEVLGVRLTQEGNHPILDWSIAELVFLGGADGRT